MKKYQELVALCNEVVARDINLRNDGFKTTSAEQRKSINAIQKLAVQSKKELIVATKDDLKQVGA